METHTSHSQKKAKCSMIVWSSTYLFLLPFLFDIFGPRANIFAYHSFRERSFSALLLILILSFPLSLLSMWYCYYKRYYKIVRFCWIFPFFLFLCCLIVSLIIFCFQF